MGGHRTSARRAGPPTSAGRAGATPHAALRLQALAGNRAVGALVQLQRDEAKPDARLGWNAGDGSGKSSDPEAPKATDVLPYKGEGGSAWDWEKILKNLSQIDSDAATTHDAFRCGPTSIIAQTIPSGPGATADAADAVVAAAKKDQHGRLKKAKGAERKDWAARPAAVAAGAKAIRAGAGTYGHLWALADLMMIYLATGPDHSSTASDLEAMGDLTEGTGSSTSASHCPDNVDDMEKVFSEALHKGESYAVLVHNGPEPRDEVPRGNHWITVGKRSDAGMSEANSLYVYDPMARTGDQVIYRSRSLDAFDAYFYAVGPKRVKYASFSVKRS